MTPYDFREHGMALINQLLALDFARPIALAAIASNGLTTAGSSETITGTVLSEVKTAGLSDAFACYLLPIHSQTEPLLSSIARGKERRMHHDASTAAEAQRHEAEETRTHAEAERQMAEQGRVVAEHQRVVQAEQHQAAEAQRQFMEEMRKVREDMRLVAEQLRESAEAVRQLHEAKAREYEGRLQQIEQMLHLSIGEFQRALVEQWKVNNAATASARSLFHSAEQLLKAAQEKTMER